MARGESAKHENPRSICITALLSTLYLIGATLHDSVLLRPEMRAPPDWDTGLKLMAARQRLDGFVSADVDYRGGSITTPPIVFSGNRLQLNHTCGALGTIFVELRDLSDRPTPGLHAGRLRRGDV